MDSIESEGPSDESGSKSISCPADFDELLAEHTPEVAISLLAQRYWDKPSELVRIASGARSLRTTRSEVRTVAIFFHALGIGGGERVTRDLTSLWVGMGLNVVLLTNVEPGEGDFELPVGVKRIVLPTFVGMTRDGYAPRCKKLLDTLRENAVDTLVFAHWFSDALAFDIMAARSLGISAFLYIQSSFTMFFLDVSMSPKYADIPLQYGLANGIVCLSEMDRLFWSNFNDNVLVTHNPLTLAPPQKQVPLDGHTIIWPARISDDKCPLRVIPIIKRLVELVPDARLAMVGPNQNPALGKRLRAIARKEGVEDHITFYGLRPAEDMPALYRSADAFLLTSEREGWSLALGEALATGLPCVIYDLPYLTLVAGNEGVVRVAQGDSEAAANALARILTDKTYAHGLGTAGRAFIEDIISYDYEGFWRSCFASALEPHQPAQSSFLNSTMWSELLCAYRSHLENLEQKHCEAVLGQQEKVAQLEAKVISLDMQADDLRTAFHKVNESTSLRVGLVFTYIPRAIKRALLHHRGTSFS